MSEQIGKIHLNCGLPVEASSYSPHFYKCAKHKETVREYATKILLSRAHDIEEQIRKSLTEEQTKLFALGEFMSYVVSSESDWNDNKTRKNTRRYVSARESLYIYLKTNFPQINTTDKLEK